MEPKGQKLFQDQRDFKIIENDFPYNFTQEIIHVCVWTKLAIESDPESQIGDVTPYIKKVLERYVEKTFVEHLGFAHNDVLWFRNYPFLQSVKDLSHIHVLLRLSRGGEYDDDLQSKKKLMSALQGQSIVPLEEADYK